MRTDIQRVKQITKEMKINDLLYNEMTNEFDVCVRSLNRVNPKKYPKAIERLYKFKRMLSILSYQDLPLKCAVGLYSMKFRLLEIETCWDKYIGDSDLDADVAELLLELGYRLYDDIAQVYETPEDVFKRLQMRRGGTKGENDRRPEFVFVPKD